MERVWNCASVVVPDGSRCTYIELQSDVAERLGTEPLPVRRGRELSRAAPRNHLFVVGDCAGLYTSAGRFFTPSYEDTVNALKPAASR